MIFSRDQIFLSLRRGSPYAILAVIGFGWYSALFLPLLLAIWVRIMLVCNERKREISGLYPFFLLLLVLVPVYFFSTGISLANPHRTGLSVLLISAVVGLFLRYNEFYDMRGFVAAFVMGMAIKVFLVVGYSFYVDSDVYGYGRLLSPLTMRETNSPAYATALVFVVSVLAYFFVVTHTLVLRLSYLFLSMLAFTLGLYLQSRAFLFVSVFVLMLLAVSGKCKGLCYLIPLFLFGGFAIWSCSYFFDLGAFDFFFPRLSDRGLNSIRWEMLAKGLGEIPRYPFGGFTMADAGVHYGQPWFHNIVVDMGRVAGWLPILAFLLLLIYSGSIYWDYGLLKVLKDSDGLFYSLLFLSSILIMQQDVILEGAPWPFYIYFFSGIGLSRLKCKWDNQLVSC